MPDSTASPSSRVPLTRPSGWDRNQAAPVTRSRHRSAVRSRSPSRVGAERVRVRAQGAEPDVAQQRPVGAVEPADQEPVTSAKASSMTSRASTSRSWPMTSGGRKRSTLP